MRQAGYVVCVAAMRKCIQNFSFRLWRTTW